MSRRISITSALICLGCLLLVDLATGQEPLARREWTIDGVKREALIYAPATAKSQATPVVFAFHGHGGTMNFVARGFAMHTQWPQAIAVYMQGLPSPGKIVDPQGKRPGWQFAVSEQGDRDLKFFDAVLASLRSDYRVDDKRIYATGHSNGGSFTYLLWAARGKEFAAVAPSGSVGVRLMKDLQPKPVLHVAGENDTLVRFSWQQATIDGLRKLNQCDQGLEWDKFCTLYPSKLDTPLVTFIHPGGHEFPAAVPAAMVKFFKQHPAENK